MPRSNRELRMAPTKSNWTDGERAKTLQKDYHNQKRFTKRNYFYWEVQNRGHTRVFRDT